MKSVSQAVLLSWSVPPATSFTLALTAVIYLRGWILLRLARVPYVPLWRAISFLLGLLSVWVALASPFDTFAGFVLTAHMLQHMVLMMVAPPLILLGSPLIPLVRGLPIFAAREFAGPFLNWRVATRVGNTLTQPRIALLLLGVAMFAWHTPRLYELALTSGSWHEVEHACFFLTSLIFWWPVLQPWPSRAQRSRWTAVPYLLAADVQNTALSAFLVFSDRVLYPSYIAVPRLFGFSAQQDQAAAGATMWVIGSLAFVIPAVLIAIQCLQTRLQQLEPSIARRRAPLRGDGFVAVSKRLSFANGFLRCRRSGRNIELISFVFLFVVTGLGWAWLARSPGDDDNQALKLHEQSAAFAVSVFAPSGNLETGASAFSVLVQDRLNQEVMPNVVVDLRAQLANYPGQTTSVRAATDSENKLLQSAEVDFSSAGNWVLSIIIRHNSDNAEFTLPIRVLNSNREIIYPWSYITLLILAAILLLTYVRQHSRPRAVYARDPLVESVRRRAADLHVR